MAHSRTEPLYVLVAGRETVDRAEYKPATLRDVIPPFTKNQFFGIIGQLILMNEVKFMVNGKSIFNQVLLSVL